MWNLLKQKDKEKGEDKMSTNFNENLRRARDFCQEAINLAEKGVAECNDDSCATLWSTIKADMGKCLTFVEKEIEGHKSKGKWD